MLSDAEPDHITERLLRRARLLSQVSDTERAYWRQVFDLANTLGKLLHAARECLDSSRLAYPIDGATMRLWEQGLMLPEEITNGTVTKAVRWYIDTIRKQRARTLPHSLSLDAFSLFNELADDAWDDHDFKNSA